MKKCPSCDKTFDDSMRFCQVDGTELVADEPAFDPYATIVAVPKPSMPSEPAASDSGDAEPSAAIAPPKVELDLPEADPLKTMYVSDDEMKAVFGDRKSAAEPDIVDVPPIEDAPSPIPSYESPFASSEPEPAADEEPEPPALPSFSVPDVPSPSFGSPPSSSPFDSPPPSSPFDSPSNPFDASPPPSPFSKPEDRFPDAAPAPPIFAEPAAEKPAFDEAATMIQPSFPAPLDKAEPPPAAEWTPPPSEWTPPPTPDASWQNQESGANAPFQPVAGASKNQTLPIVSLVLGILSLCCYISPITGLAAVITGFLGIKNVNRDPVNYGGKGLAIAGMITGGILALVMTIYYIFVILVYAGLVAGTLLQGY